MRPCWRRYYYLAIDAEDFSKRFLENWGIAVPVKPFCVAVSPKCYRQCIPGWLTDKVAADKMAFDGVHLVSVHRDREIAARLEGLQLAASGQ